MSGGLFANALLRETGLPVTAEQAERLQRLHAEVYAGYAAQVRPLPGARAADHVDRPAVLWAVATSGRRASAQPTLDARAYPRACRS